MNRTPQLLIAAALVFVCQGLGQVGAGDSPAHDWAADADPILKESEKASPGYYGVQL